MKKAYWIRMLLVCIMLFGCVLIVAGQEYRYEIGGLTGMMMYLGDANETGYLKGWNAPTLGVVFRNNLNFRWVLKTNIIKGKITGDTKNTVLPDNIKKSFKCDIFALSEQVEFNFLTYSDKFEYLNTSKFSPYILTGLGLSSAMRENKTCWGMHLPLGMGMKYKIISRVNLGMEYTIHRLFVDSFDGLDNLFRVKNGLFKNKDWYNTLLFFVTWEFALRDKRCTTN